MGEHGWTLAAVAAGWLLAELGQYWRLRRDDRRAFGRALAYALEVQRQLYFLLGLPSDETYASLSDSQRRALSAGIHSAIQKGVAARTRFEETVDLVAGVNPLLAARLRTWGTHSTAELFAEAAASPTSLGSLRALQPALAVALSRVTEIVNHLAWRHGLATWVGLKIRCGRGDASLADTLGISFYVKGQRGPTRA